METRWLLALVALVISFALPTIAQEQKSVDPKVRQQIEAIEMKFQEAYNNRDVASIVALYAPDAVEVWKPGGCLAGALKTSSASH